MIHYKQYQAYQNTDIQTASQKKLIIMLYDGMITFMNQAIDAIDHKKIEKAHHLLTKVGRILLELLSTLKEDKKSEISINLKKLYMYSYEKIVLSNLKKDKDDIEEIIQIMSNLREGWINTKVNESNEDSSVGAQKINIVQ